MEQNGVAPGQRTCTRAQTHSPLIVDSVGKTCQRTRLALERGLVAFPEKCPSQGCLSCRGEPAFLPLTSQTAPPSSSSLPSTSSFTSNRPSGFPHFLLRASVKGREFSPPANARRQYTASWEKDAAFHSSPPPPPLSRDTGIDTRVAASFR